MTGTMQGQLQVRKTTQGYELCLSILGTKARHICSALQKAGFERTFGRPSAHDYQAAFASLDDPIRRQVERGDARLIPNSFERFSNGGDSVGVFGWDVEAVQRRETDPSVRILEQKPYTTSVQVCDIIAGELEVDAIANLVKGKSAEAKRCIAEVAMLRGSSVAESLGDIMRKAEAIAKTEMPSVCTRRAQRWQS